MTETGHFDVLVYSIYPRDAEDGLTIRSLETPIAGFNHDEAAEEFCRASIMQMSHGSRLISVNVKDGNMAVYEMPPVPEVPEDDASTT